LLSHYGSFWIILESSRISWRHRRSLPVAVARRDRESLHFLQSRGRCRYPPPWALGPFPWSHRPPWAQGARNDRCQGHFQYCRGRCRDPPLWTQDPPWALEPSCTQGAVAHRCRENHPLQFCTAPRTILRVKYVHCQDIKFKITFLKKTLQNLFIN
jgi:hypothetical protein